MKELELEQSADINFLTDELANERCHLDRESAVVLAEDNFTGDEIKEFKKMYIDDGSGNLIHKRTALKWLNQGRGDI